MKYFTSEEIRSKGNQELAEHYRGYTGRNLGGLFAAKLVKNSTEKFLRIPASEAKILDYGTASGVFFRQLHNLDFRNFYGLDIDNYLDEENKPLVREMKTTDCNTDALPWPNDSFDIITAWCFLPHLENPYHCLRETHRILKNDGLFILSIPHLLSRASIKYFLKHKDFARYHPAKNHVTAFTPGVFQIAISRYFQPVAMEYLIDQRSLTGFKGKIRNWILRVSRINQKLEKYFKERWGYNQIWILKKKNAPR